MTAVPGVAFLAGAGVGQSALHVPPTLIPAHSWNQITSLLEGNPLVMGGHATPMHLLTYLSNLSCNKNTKHLVARRALGIFNKNKQIEGIILMVNGLCLYSFIF